MEQKGMQMVEGLKEQWAGMSRAARVGLVSGIAVVAALLLFGAVWILRDDYQVLFSDLNPQDASAMVGELDRMKVPYRLADGGTAILVERDAVYKTRLKLMGKGVDLRGAVGFEIFNNADFGMTDFAQKVNFQRALQGELARTIMAFDEVKFARVHLVLPESGLLKRQNAKPKASISLTMKAGSHLAAEQISGIQRLVAASVPEIEPSAVTIVDQHGVAVSKPGEDGIGGVAGRLEAKRQIEEYLTRKVVAVLDRAVGPGKAIVSVDVSLSYDQIKSTKEDVLPLPNTSGQNVGAIARRRDTSQGGDPFGDVVSAASPIRAGQGGSSAATATSEVEFLNGRRVEQVVSPPGAIRRMSVGVVVPGITDPVELAKLKEVVAMAVGVNAERGDAIVVYNQAAPGADADQAENDAQPVGASDGRRDPSHLGASMIWAWALAAAAALLAGFLWLDRKRSRPGAPARLSPIERERLLKEIAQWAAVEKG